MDETKWHMLSELDEFERTGVCSQCGPVSIYKRNVRYGKQKWRCGKQASRYVAAHKKPWQKLKGDTCNRCGFAPQHRRQLDVHHMDRNKKNNDPSNLETICANCHRLEHAYDND